MSIMSLLDELKSSLATSDSAQRKYWANQIIQADISLESLMSLWQCEPKTAQRFMWLIGDICERDPERVSPCLPFLFSLLGQVPFPGLDRSLAKWFGLTNVPPEIEQTAIPQLFAWLELNDTPIGCKSFAAKTLFQLALDKRVSIDRLLAIMDRETEASNRAYAGRIRKLRSKLASA